MPRCSQNNGDTLRSPTFPPRESTSGPIHFVVPLAYALTLRARDACPRCAARPFCPPRLLDFSS
jgi:hypothetical protein